MMKIRVLRVVFILLIGGILLGYRIHDSLGPRLPATHFNYANIKLPAHLAADVVQAMDNTPENNPITDAGATLVWPMCDFTRMGTSSGMNVRKRWKLKPFNPFRTP